MHLRVIHSYRNDEIFIFLKCRSVDQRYSMEVIEKNVCDQKIELSDKKKTT